MARYTIETPSGRRIQVEAANEEAAYRGAQEYEAQNPPHRNAFQRAGGAIASAAEGVTDTVTGAVQEGLGALAHRTGLDRAPVVQNAFRRLDDDAANRPRYTPQGGGERAIYNTSRFAPNAFAPGTALQRGLSVAGPVVGGEVGERLGGSNGRMVGEIAGVVAGNIRRPNAPSGPRPTRAQRGAARVVGGGPRQAQTSRTRQAEYEAAGVRPTAADVVTTQGRRNIRAAATRSEGAQERVRTLNTNRSASLGGRISQQARRTMSDDTRTPDQIREEIGARRSAQADREFGAVRGESFPMDPETVTALRTDYGRAAIREAARRENDPEARAALLRLADDALDSPSTRVTVGMMDRVSRVLLSQAQEAGRRGDNDLAQTLGRYGRGIRNPARTAVPGYGDALDNYAAETRLGEAATTGEGFLAHNTDEFAAAVGNMSDDERAVAQAAARRAVERAAGENPGSAPGVARRIAGADEQHTRSVALLGEERAQALEAAMAAEERLVQNARDIDPRTGSQTQPNLLTDERFTGAMQAGGQLAKGDPLGAAWTFLRTRGISERDAEQYVMALTDPGQTEAVLRALEARSPGAGQELLRVLQNPTLALTFSAATAGASANQ